MRRRLSGLQLTSSLVRLFQLKFRNLESSSFSSSVHWDSVTAKRPMSCN